MKELKNRVIRLGVDRGYLPRNAGDNSLEKFDIQYLRFIEEIGEASRELRLKNEDAFKMEIGDALVLHTNCLYILDEYLVGFDGLNNSLNLSFCTLEKLIKMYAYNHIEFKKECLQLAYDKIIARGGMLINGDWFKPTDKEYIEHFKNK